MCFYDQKRMKCGDFKWGHFRQHCDKEYRTGETCGMKWVMQTYDVDESCRLCEKIEVKRRHIIQEEERMIRWRQERGRLASIERAESEIRRLQLEIYSLVSLRDDAKNQLLDLDWAVNLKVNNPAPNSSHSSPKAQLLHVSSLKPAYANPSRNLEDSPRIPSDEQLRPSLSSLPSPAIAATLTLIKTTDLQPTPSSNASLHGEHHGPQPSVKSTATNENLSFSPHILQVTAIGLKRSWDGEEDQQSETEPRNQDQSNANDSNRREEQKHFSCPFRKHNPEKYNLKDWKICALTSYQNIARLKEHLYRRHLIGIQCPRCWELFSSQDLLNTHSRMPTSCEILPMPTEEGITATMLTRIKSRKKSRPDQSEASRWNDIYITIFPQEPVPSPYFEPVQETSRASKAHEVTSFESFSSRELPRLFRNCLEAAVSEEESLKRDKLRRRLVNMVTACHEQVLKMFHTKVSKQGTQHETPEKHFNSSPIANTKVHGESSMHSPVLFMQLSPHSTQIPEKEPSSDADKTHDDVLDLASLPSTRVSDLGFDSFMDDNEPSSTAGRNYAYNLCGCYSCDVSCFCYCHYVTSPETR